MLRRLALAALLALAPQLAAAQFATIGPTPPVTDNSDRLATTGFVNNFFALGIPLANGKIFVGSAGGLATAQTMSGDCTMVATGVITCTQAAGNFQVIGNLTVGGSIIDGSGILATNIAAPATPAAGTTRIYVDSTSKALTFKNDAGTVGNAVVPSTCAGQPVCHLGFRRRRFRLHATSGLQHQRVRHRRRYRARCSHQRLRRHHHTDADARRRRRLLERLGMGDAGRQQGSGTWATVAAGGVAAGRIASRSENRPSPSKVWATTGMAP
jgi:hypothetical protein